VCVCVCGVVPAKMGSLSTSCVCRNIFFLIFKSVSESPKKVRCKMWFDGENEPLNVEFIQGVPGGMCRTSGECSLC